MARPEIARPDVLLGGARGVRGPVRCVPAQAAGQVRDRADPRRLRLGLRPRILIGAAMMPAVAVVSPLAEPFRDPPRLAAPQPLQHRPDRPWQVVALVDEALV